MTLIERLELGGPNAMEAAPEAVAELKRLQAENRRLRDVKRWNIKEDFGDLLICTGSHHRSDNCEFHRYRPVAE